MKNNESKKHPIGVILVNVGSPSEPTRKAVRKYLSEFLSDERVIDIPYIFRMLLLYFIILPFRTIKSTKLYKSIWKQNGSPLISHTKDLSHQVQLALGEDYIVKVAMRYGAPLLSTAFQELITAHAKRIIIFPLFPQYSSATTGSSYDAVGQLTKTLWNVPALTFVPPFYHEPAFINAFAEPLSKTIVNIMPDFILFSYHGLPTRHIEKSDLSCGNYCLKKENCCNELSASNQYCYRYQCFETTRAIVIQLNLPKEKYQVSFQSRLGRSEWIKPYTNEVLVNLAKKGIKNLLVICPSFVSDCLETLEEIEISAQKKWLTLGGKSLILLPSLNTNPQWVQFVAQKIRES